MRHLKTQLVELECREQTDHGLRETLRDFCQGVMFREFKIGRNVEATPRANEITRGYETGELFA
jgi:hypothetical protein